MKQSINHFPESTRKELEFLTKSIKRHVPKCVMIILYGSYARDEYVLWDERLEFGLHTSYQSDLDILVVISESNVRITEWQLEEKVVEAYHKVFAHCCHAAPQFIVEDINFLNRQLEKRHYFYTDVVKDGILLYDNLLFELAKPLTLSYKEIKAKAEEEFQKCFPFANGFLKHARLAFEDGMYELGAFELHQVCERYYHSISLVFGNYRPKSHKLKDLESKNKRFCRKLVEVFPLNTEFEKRCYDLLCRAYIESRYNKDYTVAREELEYMLQRTELFRDITEEICKAQFKVYDRFIEKETTGCDSYDPEDPEIDSGMAADPPEDY